MIEKLKKSSEYLVYICGILLLTSVLMISIEVVLRKFFLISLGGTDELSGYVLGICMSWSLAYVLFEKMHIRIDIIYSKVGERLQNLFDMISMVFTLLFIGLLVYFSSSVFYTSLIKQSTANTPLGTPLWIPQLVWIFGYVFFFVVVLILSFKALRALYTKKSDKDVNVGGAEYDISID